MPGQKPRKTSAKALARTRAHDAHRKVHFLDTISFRCPTGTLAEVADAAELDGVSPAEWLRGLLRRGLQASRKKRARRVGNVKTPWSGLLLGLLLAAPLPARA